MKQLATVAGFYWQPEAKDERHAECYEIQKQQIDNDVDIDSRRRNRLCVAKIHRQSGTEM